MVGEAERLGQWWRRLSVERIDILFELDMHYVGQTHTVSVPLPVSVQNGTTGIDGAVVRQAFERSYQTSFSRLLPGVPAKIVNLRTAAVAGRISISPPRTCRIGEPRSSKAR